MKEVKITCDGCNRDLTTASAMPEYRLVLSCERLPHNGVVCMIHVKPPINDTLYFCNLGCLSHYLNEWIE